MDILRAWRRQREGEMERERPLILCFSFFFIVISAPPPPNTHTNTHNVSDCRAGSVSSCRRLEKSAVNECYFPRSKFISYVNAPSNCIGFVTRRQLLHLMVLHNCINTGHICMTLMETVVLPKRDDGRRWSQSIAAHRHWCAALWKIHPCFKWLSSGLLLSQTKMWSVSVLPLTFSWKQNNKPKQASIDQTRGAKERLSWSVTVWETFLRKYVLPVQRFDGN